MIGQTSSSAIHCPLDDVPELTAVNLVSNEQQKECQELLERRLTALFFVRHAENPLAQLRAEKFLLRRLTTISMLSLFFGRHVGNSFS